MFKRRKREDDFPDWDIPDDPGWGDEFDAPPRRRRAGCLVLGVLLLVVVAALGVWWSGRENDTIPVEAYQPQLESSMIAPQEMVSSPTASIAPVPTMAAVPTNPPVTELSPNATPEPGKPVPGVYDPAALGAYMLRLINADRAAYGLAPVAWDETAALAGARHAEDMVAQGYFSHWSTDGLGPDHRYSLLGGEHAAMENLHALAYTYNDGRGAPIENWASVIEQAQAGLMLSTGHRANILDPAHTHVGIGMAYDPLSGEFRLAQEFTNQYVTLSVSPPVEAPAGSTIRVAGRFADGPFTNFILNLAYEPWPEPMTPDELNATYTYRSAAESRDGRLVDRAFDESLTLGEPGLYHVRLFVDLPTGQALVVDRLLEVR